MAQGEVGETSEALRERIAALEKTPRSERGRLPRGIRRTLRQLRRAVKVAESIEITIRNRRDAATTVVMHREQPGFKTMRKRVIALLNEMERARQAAEAEEQEREKYPAKFAGEQEPGDEALAQEMTRELREPKPAPEQKGESQSEQPSSKKRPPKSRWTRRRFPSAEESEERAAKRQDLLGKAQDGRSNLQARLRGPKSSES